MRVMVLVKATAWSEAGPADAPELFEAMGRYNAALEAAGILRMGDGLTPTSRGKRVMFEGEGRRVVDGPFVPPEAQVAGFWLWEVRDMEEAMAWAVKCPRPMPGPCEIEVRPLYELADRGLA
jgi:hypothetical protein